MMEEILLLPQWAQNKQEQREESLKRLAEGARDFVRALQRWMGDLAKAIMPVIERMIQVLGPYCGMPDLKVQKSKPKPRKRSSRRGLIQAKRKRLGLSVDGKIAPFIHDGKLCKPTRKQCLHTTLQAKQSYLSRQSLERKLLGAG